MNKNKLLDCRLIELPQNHNCKGRITAVNGGNEVPFQIKRVYYMYDIPADEVRGGHAHIELESLIVAASGSFDVVLDDGYNRKVYTLNRPFVGLNVKPGIWRDIVNFSAGSICLVLASELYSEADYIRSYSDYKEYVRRHA